jgi:hypothetical protein
MFFFHFSSTGKKILLTVLAVCFVVFGAVPLGQGLEKFNPPPLRNIGGLALLDHYFVENTRPAEGSPGFWLKFSGGRAIYQRDSIEYRLHLRSGDKPAADIRFKFLGANAAPSLEGREPAATKISRFKGNDQRDWIQGARTFQRLIYRDLYPGIDLNVRAGNSEFKHEYRVRPGGNPGKIKVRVEGVRNLHLDDKGRLIMDMGQGALVKDRPLSYQVIDGKRIVVPSAYRLLESGVYGYQVKGYRQDAELVIDPLLSFATLLGGGSDDEVAGIAVDSEGNAYVTGYTYSPDFPVTAGAFIPDVDVYVVKVDHSGEFLHYATFISGRGVFLAAVINCNASATGIAVDSSGCAYITGWTYTSAFPTTPGAYDRTFNGGVDIFVTKLNASGTDLVYSTFLGGSSVDRPWGGIAVDVQGCAYITGYTESNQDFPTTPGAFSTVLSGGVDAFVTKLNASGSGLVYSTFLGGSNGWDEGDGIKVDDQGQAVVGGSTDSTNFPTTANAYDTTLNGNGDVFAVKFNAAGSSLIFSTLVGGTDWEGCEGVALSPEGSVYLVGYTTSDDFPTSANAFSQHFGGGGYDGVLLRLNSTASDLEFSTYLGGDGDEFVKSVFLDSSGHPVVTGWTGSHNFPTTANALYPQPIGESDVFITKLDEQGSSLIYSTLLGGSRSDSGKSVVLDADNNILLAGWTNSFDFSTPNAFDSTYNLNGDGFAAKLAWVQPPLNVTAVKTLNRSLFRKEAVVTIRWGANPANEEMGVSAYRVYRRQYPAGNRPFQMIAELSSDKRSYDDHNIDLVGIYEYCLTAVDAQGVESEFSNKVVR